MKTKVAYLDDLRLTFSSFLATFNGFCVINDLDDLRMYIISTSSDHQDR